MGGAAGEERLRGLADREALQGGQHQRLHDVRPPGHRDQQLHREGRGAQPDVHIPGAIHYIQSYNKLKTQLNFPGFCEGGQGHTWG